MEKNIFFFFILFVLIVSAVPASQAAIENGQIETLKIDAQYKKGVIEKTPYQSDYLRIKIDRVTYILMKNCKVFRRTASSSGGFQDTAIDPSELSKGEKVFMRAHGNRIFQIIVIE